MAEYRVGEGDAVSYGAVLRRFWWLVPIACTAALLAAVATVYTIPALEPRDPVLYTANARLLVTSAEGSYIRVSVPRAVETAPSSTSDADSGTANATSGSSEAPSTSASQPRGSGGPLIVYEPPDVRPLLAATNLYPLLIESDLVQSLREQMFGQIAGTVTARAVAAVETPTRYVPSQLPVVDIFATSRTPEQAVALTRATSRAFMRWITLAQERARLTRDERILIEPLVAPQETVLSGGPSFGIPVLVVLAVLAAFGVLALVLDRVLVGSTSVRPSET